MKGSRPTTGRVRLAPGYGLALTLAAASSIPQPANSAAWLGTPETVLSIARFASWPAEARYGMTFRICLRDDDPAIGEFLSLRTQSIGGRPVSLHVLHPQAFAVRPCHIAYFSPGLAEASILEALGDKPVLTVSPDKGFAARGGDVELSAGEAGFLIDRKNAARGGITLSAQILTIARETTP